MRLLRRNDDGEFRLWEFVDGNIPPYAILSHVWDDEEVTLEDMMNGTGKHKAGYRKDQAARDGLQYFWVDICCIDKSSSAELQEAINSQFAWYHNAICCYVYLSDVSTGPHIAARSSTRVQLRSSRWFSRGWTLQELIAPASVKFFSREGTLIGDRNSLVQDIHEITDIPVSALQGTPLSKFSVEERMSRAKTRLTRREEDAAYSLMGLFDVYMPVIYGEGRSHALNRLRREIQASSNHTTFSSRTVDNTPTNDAWNHVVTPQLTRNTSTGARVSAVLDLDSDDGSEIDTVFSDSASSVSSSSTANLNPVQTVRIREVSRALLNEEELKGAEGDDSSDEELNDDLPFPHIDKVKEFLINSEAFRGLVLAMQAWLKIDGVDQKNVVESITDTPKPTDSIVVAEETQRETIVSVEDQEQADSTNEVSPTSCNTILWGDFPVEDTAAFDQLKQQLSCMRDLLVRHVPTSGTSTTQATGVSGSGATESAPSTQTSSAGPPSGLANRPRAGNAQNIVSSTASGSDYVVEITSPFKYFEVCVSTGNHAIDHHEVDISRISSDNELFEMIWDKYNISRGIGLRRLFLRPSDVNFVMFSVGQRNQYGAGIHKKPDEFPPQEELDEKRYHYLCPRIRMPVNVFLHYLDRARWNIWGEHMENIWLQRLPKKLDRDLIAEAQQAKGNAPANEDLAFGWGIHIIEGPNHAVLGLLLAIGVAVAFVVSGMIVGFAKTQEQGFGVRNFLLAILASTMTAVYFQLQD
ncbi:unnamed protein product [Alternaria alternata]